MLYILGVHWSVFNWIQQSRDHLVWDPCRSETFTAQRPQSTCRHSRDQAYQCRTWPQCAARQRTGDVATHQQILRTMLLSSLTHEEGLTYTGSHYHMQTVSAFDWNWLVYCNSILTGLPKSTTAYLHCIQNVEVRPVYDLGPSDHVTKSLRELHWLPIQFCIVYKLCLMMHDVHKRCSPGYIKDILTPMAGLPNRQGGMNLVTVV